MAGSYALSDLVGTWLMESIVTGPGAPDWTRGTITVGSDGSFTGTLISFDGGSENVNGRLSLTSDGRVTCQTCGSNYLGILDAGKTVVIGSDNDADTPQTVSLSVLVKQGSSYNQSDLAGGWQMHELAGPAQKWVRGSLLVDSSGLFQGRFIDSEGNLSTPVGTLTLNGSGIVFCPLCGVAFEGVLDAGKTLFAATEGTSTLQSMSLTARVLPPYAQADLAGSWFCHAASSGSSAVWRRGLLTIDGSGALSGTLDSSDGTQVPAMGSLIMSPLGIAVHNLLPSMECVLDSDKTILVCTGPDPGGP
ncbi:MAG: hypothetical protein D6815_11790 [Candidatus Dadabacteria bacterium]|nr:MAG: hypothetical protein D6815_11790 [Candidatus Dadabacteria bacterium]